MRLTRRGLLVGAAAGGGLLVAYAMLPRRYAPPVPAGDGETAFGAWLRIAEDGVVTVAMPAFEGGQGISTVLAQVAAVELGADWRQVAVEPAAVSAAYANPVLAAHWASLWMPFAFGAAADPQDTLARLYAERERLMVSAAGTELAAWEAPLREAAASARAMLAQAAAARWDVGWEECAAEAGFIVHQQKRLRFGELAAEAAAFDPPDPPVLRAEPARERPMAAVIGAPPDFPRLDLPAKVDGGMTFAGDVRLPGMVHAAIAHAPVGDTRLARFDTRAAARIPGVVGVVKGRGWIAAAAADWWTADRAVRALAPRFRADGLLADSERIAAALDAALRRGEASRLAELGSPDDLLGRPSLSARYTVEPALHAPLETASATARLTDGRLELWLATQAPEQARQAAAAALDLSPGDVVIYRMAGGGSFEARLDHAIALEAAAIARALDRPVQLTRSRWQEALASFPRTPAAALLSARTVEGGGIAAWKARLALPATAREAGARLLEGASPRGAIEQAAGEADALACAGAFPAYAIPAVAVDHVPVRLALPTGFFRGQAHGYTAFFTESFIDELAHAARREPLSYRVGMLGNDTRLAACLTGVARLANWGGGDEGAGQGLACHRMEIGGRTGRIAVIATARRDEGGVRVDRLSAFADVGRIVNLDIARQQIESGLVFGMATAMGDAARYAQGLPVGARLAQLDLPRLADCPQIDVAFADSAEPPFDPGELGVPAAAPAIANALFSATGVRFRGLPLLSEGL